MVVVVVVMMMMVMVVIISGTIVPAVVARKGIQRIRRCAPGSGPRTGRVYVTEDIADVRLFAAPIARPSADGSIESFHSMFDGFCVGCRKTRNDWDKFRSGKLTTL